LATDTINANAESDGSIGIKSGDGSSTDYLKQMYKLKELMSQI